MLWITLEGAVNVRDVGGMPTDDGSVTADKRLLRADNLQGLSVLDVSRLVEEFGLTRVVDLRTVGEVSSEGPGPLTAVASVEHRYHSLLRANDLESEEDINESLLTRRRARSESMTPDEVVAGRYLEYLLDRPDSVVAALRAIADTSGAALVHCAAGKDRTGVIVALTLRAVGVDRDAVVADYAATAERIEAILARLRASATYVNNVDKITAAQHTPRAAAMEAFLDLVESRHAGVPEWLADQGFGPADLDQLRHKLLAA
jgi:protein-tyrosine phosphatase